MAGSYDSGHVDDPHRTYEATRHYIHREIKLHEFDGNYFNNYNVVPCQISSQDVITPCANLFRCTLLCKVNIIPLFCFETFVFRPNCEGRFSKPRLETIVLLRMALLLKSISYINCGRIIFRVKKTYIMCTEPRCVDNRMVEVRWIYQESWKKINDNWRNTFICVENILFMRNVNTCVERWTNKIGNNYGKPIIVIFQKRI